MSSTPAVIPFYGEGAGRLFSIYCDVTHACGDSPAHDPHVAHDLPRRALNASRGEAQRTKNYYGKILPRLPVHRFGLAQQRITLMYGPDPGAPVGVQT